MIRHGGVFGTGFCALHRDGDDGDGQPARGEGPQQSRGGARVEQDAACAADHRDLAHVLGAAQHPPDVALRGGRDAGKVDEDEIAAGALPRYDR